MNVLVGCEMSGVVREAFRRKGHNAWSCDLQDAQDHSPFHIKGDLLAVLQQRQWDMLIAHPPCTYLCNSGVGRLVKTPANPGPGVLYGPTRWQAVKDGSQFFLDLLNCGVPKICLENPVMHRYAVLPKPNQYVQPYQFGDDASKKTGLWLRGLPPLEIPDKTLWVPGRKVGKLYRWGNQTDSGQNKLGPSAHRAQQRAETYPGIADAMAAQWGK